MEHVEVVGAVMVKPALVAEVRLGLLADRVYVPAVLMVRLLKVATPFCGVSVNVPARPVPPTRASVTGFVAVVITLPLPSSTDTWTAGVIIAPVDPFEGCCKKASFAGGSAEVMVRVEEATPLDTPANTAMAFTVDETAIEIGPVYTFEELVGTVPSVV
jgi:hypothetical protein